MQLPALNCLAPARVLAKSPDGNRICRHRRDNKQRRIFALKNFQEWRDCASIFQAMEPPGNVRRASCVGDNL